MEIKKQNELVSEVERLKKKLKKKEKRLRELRVNNLFLESLFNGINEEIMVVDNDYNIVNVNNIFLSRYGMKKHAVIDKKCYEIKQRYFAPCNLKGKECPVGRSRESGDMVETTHSYRDNNGNNKDYVLIIYPLKPDGENIQYFLEIARDVTEYRQLIKRLQSSERRFKAILDTATDAVISVDENHKIIIFNNAANKTFGYSNDEIIGQDLSRLIPDSYGNHSTLVKRFLESRRPEIIGKTISLTALRKNGEEFPIELSLSFLEMGGRATFTAIVRDVTEHQQMEGKLLQSERLAAVGKAVAHVAHEIKNPLMIIGGFSNQIKMNLENGKDRHKIDMVLDEVMRLERLVANLGDFTKEYRLVKRPADINSVIKDVIRIMKGICDSGKHIFRHSLSEDVNEVDCDPDKMKQVFINVISNGLEAMNDGGVISISTERIDKMIEIKIHDTGTGIPEEDLKNIFEPFYTTRERGSGLGLSISFKLMEAHDGDIWVESRPGEGTTFIMQLPCAG